MSKKFLSIARLFILSMFLFLPTVVHAEIFFQDGFESGILVNQQIWEWIANNPNDPCYSDGQIVPTTEDKFSGIYSAKFINNIGDMCSFMGAQFSRSVGQGEDIYFRFRLKYSANREWNLGGGDKVAAFFGNSRQPGGEWILFTLERGYHDSSHVIPVSNDPHMAQPLIYVAAANTNVFKPCNDPEGYYFCQNIDQGNPFYVTAGQWYTVEIYVKVDAYGAGQLKLWIDGKQLIDINNIYTIRGATNPGFYRFDVGGTFNQPDYVNTIANNLYFDDVLVSDTCSSCSQSYLQFSSATYDVSETGATATVTVTRTGSSAGAVSVDYATSNGTATAGSDYTATSGTLSWADGDAAAKSFTITITNDTTVESSETVNITLSNPNGAQISGTNPVVLTITDNDGGGGDTGGSGGGDTSASGGSGCGFVKDDGKGQRAKDEGVSMMILLFLLLFLLRIKRSYQYKWQKAGIAKTMLFFITTALIFLLFTGITHAATYYVSPTGTAQWPACTDISTPCTAKTAMENAIAGDIVYFRGGVYNPIDDPVQQWLDTPVQFRYQLPVWNPKNSGTEGNPITFMAYHGETPEILDAPDSAVLGAYRRDYIVLDGFRATLIDEDPLSNDTHLVSQLIRFDESLHSVIRNCDFKGTKFGRHTNNSLITIQRSHYMLIEGNKLHDNNGLQDTDPEFKEYAVNTNAIINFWSSDIVIRNNDIYNNYIGIWDKGAERNNQYYHNHIWGGSDYYTSCKQGIYMRATLNVQGPATGVRAYQNVIRNCGVGVQIEDVSYHDFPEVRVYNNTIVGNDSYHNNAGVFVADNARYAEIFNNIIVGYPVQVRYYTGASTIVSYSNYNDFYSSSANKRWAINWSNDYSTIDLWRAATNLDINSIESNPQFINPGGANPADYKLQANSPARIGRGGSYATVMGAFITGNETIGYDPDAPRVEITSPPNSTVTTTNTSITISGTATDTLGIVSVTWNNDRGGSGTAWSGTATQNVNWTVSNIPLQSGQNIITVTVTDGDAKTGVDVLIVNPTNSNGGDTGDNTGSSGGDSGGGSSGGGGCGFVKKDGKGLRAKGEGVAFAIMLIIALTVVFVLRRATKTNHI